MPIQSVPTLMFQSLKEKRCKKGEKLVLKVELYTDIVHAYRI